MNNNHRLIIQPLYTHAAPFTFAFSASPPTLPENVALERTVCITARDHIHAMVNREFRIL